MPNRIRSGRSVPVYTRQDPTRWTQPKHDPARPSRWTGPTKGGAGIPQDGVAAALQLKEGALLYTGRGAPCREPLRVYTHPRHFLRSVTLLRVILPCPGVTRFMCASGILQTRSGPWPAGA
jgi:hypothetical protein